MSHAIKYTALFVSIPLLLLAAACSSDAALRDGAVQRHGAAPPLALQAGPELARFEGSVLVLLMGMPGCPGTEAATRFLRELEAEGAEGVAVLRLDVPPPEGGSLPPPDPEPGIPYAVDAQRETADALDFFSYPTLYVFDRDGAARYRGGCEPDTVRSVVAALLKEEPGAAKTDFSRVQPAPGSPAAAFEAPAIDGRTVTLESLRGSRATLLVFSSLNCPFSKTAMRCVPRLAADFKDQGVAVAVVNPGADAETIRSFYESTVPGVPVIADRDGSISTLLYGVQTVPFFYVVDGQGRIAYRMPFDEQTVREALDAVLGASGKAPKERSRGAG